MKKMMIGLLVFGIMGILLGGAFVSLLGTISSWGVDAWSFALWVVVTPIFSGLWVAGLWAIGHMMLENEQPKKSEEMKP